MQLKLLIWAEVILNVITEVASLLVRSEIYIYINEALMAIIFMFCKGADVDVITVNEGIAPKIP